MITMSLGVVAGAFPTLAALSLVRVKPSFVTQSIGPAASCCLHCRVAFVYIVPSHSCLSYSCSVFACRKPRGINAARKMRIHRLDQRWADVKYRKTMQGSSFRYNPFGLASHAKGIVVEKV